VKSLNARPIRWTIAIICVLVGLRALGASNAVAQLVSRWLQTEVYEDEGMVERRVRWFEEQRVSPGEVVPEDALVRGWYQRLAAEQRRDRVATAAEAIGWRSIGPAPDQLAPSTNTGRVRALAVHPQDPSIIYVGSASGGVWKSTDDGASYRPVTDRQCSLNTGAIAIDPVTPRIIYVGTGEPRVSAGCGVLRSIDDGETWTDRTVVLPYTDTTANWDCGICELPDGALVEQECAAFKSRITAYETTCCRSRCGRRRRRSPS